MSLADVRRFVGVEAGEPLPSHAWPGGYPLVYVTTDGGTLCAGAECANGPEVADPDPSHGWRLEGASVHYEGPPEVCDHCGAEVPSAYGDPDAPDDDDATDDDATDDAPACPACGGGPLEALGALGARVHSRCRACGAQSSREVPR